MFVTERRSMLKQIKILIIVILAVSTLAATAQITGSGTAGYVPVFTGSGTSVGNSSPWIYESGSNVGIGTTSPQTTLDVVPPITKSDTTAYGYGMLSLRTDEASGFSSLGISFLGGSSQTVRGFQFQTG